LTTRNITNATIRKVSTVLRKFPYVIALSPTSIFNEPKSGCPKIAAMIGVTMSATNDATTAANASATTSPTAISTRLPLM
jgi:hypothetical protein